MCADTDVTGASLSGTVRVWAPPHRFVVDTVKPPPPGVLDVVITASGPLAELVVSLPFALSQQVSVGRWMQGLDRLEAIASD